MTTRVSIGDFSRMTHLSVKTLRHYHEVGLLAPVEIDGQTGYRYYARSQVPTAQVIRRFRALEMPLDELRTVLGTSDPARRAQLIATHLERLELQLKATQAAVASLRALLEAPAAVAIEYRTVAAVTAAAITERVGLAEVTAWMSGAFSELRRLIGAQGVTATGAPGALWPLALFTDEEGEATVFLPVSRGVRPMGRLKPCVVPSAELAFAVHRGAHSDVDRTYGALGSHVSEREVGVEGPVREYYLVDAFSTSDSSQWLTEIAWPIFRAKG
jgi:DNA-binding transcriptional MerR regulator